MHADFILTKTVDKKQLYIGFCLFHLHDAQHLVLTWQGKHYPNSYPYLLV